jgi:hypothetical protein
MRDMNIIWQSKGFSDDKIVSQYALLSSNGDVKVFDVDARHKTIREWFTKRTSFPLDVSRCFTLGEKVLMFGLTMQDRESRL